MTKADPSLRARSARSLRMTAPVILSAAGAKDLLRMYLDRYVPALTAPRSPVSNRFRPDRHPRHPELLARLRPSRRQRLGRPRAHLRDGVFAARLAGPARLDARATHESRHRSRAARSGRVAQRAARLAAPR